MAELDTSGGGKHKGGKKVRSKKQSTRVDLTAMVDLAFLLITFFILTTTLAKPKAMELIMPDKDKDQVQQLPVPASRTMTLLLGSHDKLEWFVGEPGKSSPTIMGYGKNDLRKTLIDQNKAVMQASGGKAMIVIVSPSAKSTYNNVVTVMDELNIVDIEQRAIVDITPTDLALLKKDGLD
jgi:biopolymer transport protein ExbD